VSGSRSRARRRIPTGSRGKRGRRWEPRWRSAAAARRLLRPRGSALVRALLGEVVFGDVVFINLDDCLFRFVYSSAAWASTLASTSVCSSVESPLSASGRTRACRRRAAATSFFVDDVGAVEIVDDRRQPCQRDGRRRRCGALTVRLESSFWRVSSAARQVAPTETAESMARRSQTTASPASRASTALGRRQSQATCRVVVLRGSESGPTDRHFCSLLHERSWLGQHTTAHGQDSAVLALGRPRTPFSHKHDDVAWLVDGPSAVEAPARRRTRWSGYGAPSTRRFPLVRPGALRS